MLHTDPSGRCVFAAIDTIICGAAAAYTVAEALALAAAAGLAIYGLYTSCITNHGCEGFLTALDTALENPQHTGSTPPPLPPPLGGTSLHPQTRDDWYYGTPIDAKTILCWLNPFPLQPEVGPQYTGVPLRTEQGPVVVTATPHGFNTYEELEQFGSVLYKGLQAAGYTDAEAVLQGSAVTGRNSETGDLFDVGRTSDFDVGIASETAFIKALDIGLDNYYKTGPERIGPINVGSPQAIALEINGVLLHLTQQYGREVNVVLYPSLRDAYRGGSSYPIQPHDH